MLDEPSRQLSRQCCNGEFFQLLKHERIKRRIYATRGEARVDLIDDIEVFYNRKRRRTAQRKSTGITLLISEVRSCGTAVVRFLEVKDGSGSSPIVRLNPTGA